MHPHPFPSPSQGEGGTKRRTGGVENIMPSELNTKAIVTSALPYGDSDLVVSFLTVEHGLIKGFAKGARKSRKRFAGCFEPFTLLTLKCKLKEQGMLARVETADIIDTHLGIRDGLARIGAAAQAVELSAMLEAPGAGSAAVFSLLAETLGLIEKSMAPQALSAVFIVKLIGLAGYGIPHRQCGKCGAVLTGKKAIYLGGHSILCTSCGGSGDVVTLSPGSLAFIRRAESIEPQSMGRLRLPASSCGEVYRFLGDYLPAVTGKRLKTLDNRGDFC
jgi:DNA repair protein RecO (recombination protein O)